MKVLIHVPFGAGLVIDAAYLAMFESVIVVDDEIYPPVVRRRKDQALRFETIALDRIQPVIEEPPAAAALELAPPELAMSQRLIDDDLPF